MKDNFVIEDRLHYLVEYNQYNKFCDIVDVLVRVKVKGYLPMYKFRFNDMYTVIRKRYHEQRAKSNI